MKQIKKVAVKTTKTESVLKNPLKDLISAHFQYGKQRKIAVVFSCPGQEEAKQNSPLSGITGVNFEIILELLFEKKVFKENLKKRDLRITNAWDKVLFKGNNASKRTEASLSDIYSEKNLERLKNELDDIEDMIICFGEKAKKAVKRLKLVNTNLTIIECCHLSLQSLNSNKGLRRDVYGNPIVKGESENTKKRLKVLASSIENKIKDSANKIEIK